MNVTNILFLISFGILIYMIVLNAFYSLNLMMAAIILPMYNKRYFFTKGISIEKHVSKSFSILVPAYNEEKTIVDSVKSLLSLDYEAYEVIVANDGSKDKTLDILISTFEFVKVDVQPNGACSTLVFIYEYNKI